MPMEKMHTQKKRSLIGNLGVKLEQLANWAYGLFNFSQKVSKTSTFFVLLACLLSSDIFAADYVFVVDTSGSMTQPISRKDRRVRITTVQEAMRNYLNAIPADSRTTLISFNTGIASEKELILRNDTERQEALQWVDQLDAEARKNGDTYLWSTVRRALQVASSYSKQSPEQTVVVRVLTDGQDTEGRFTLEQILAEFPDVNGTAIRANLVLLGDLEIPLRAKRIGFDIVHDPNFTVMFPPVIRWSPMPPRVDQDVSFFDNSQSAYQFYEWRIDGKLVGQQKAVTHRFTTSGDHIINLVVTGTGGTKDLASVRVGVLDAEKEEPMAPTFVYSPTAPEPGQLVRFFGRSAGKPVSYSWQIDGKEFATTQDAESLFQEEGTFQVKLIVRNAKGTDAEKLQALSVVEPAINVQFKAVSETVSGQTVQFVNETGGRVSSFEWDFGDGHKDTSRNPTHIFRNEGNTPIPARVSLRATTPAGKTFSSQPATVSILPPARVPVPQAVFRIMGEKIKAGSLVQFIDESTGLIDSYSWNFGKDGNSTKKNPEFRFDEPGVKTVELKVRGPGGAVSTLKTLTVLKPSLSAVLSWIDAHGNSCDPPKEVAFGDIPPQHVRNQQYLSPPFDTFEMVLPDELPADGGVLITLEGKTAEACDIVRILSGGEKTSPVTDLVRESGRFRLVLKAAAAEGEFTGNIVIQPRGNDVLLNQQAKPITVPIQLRIGSPGWGVGLIFLILVATGAGFFLWSILRGKPLRYPLIVTLREISPQTNGQKTDDKATLRPVQEFELARIADKINFGKDGSIDGKTFDLNAPGFFLMGQRKHLTLHNRSGGQPKPIKNSDEINVTDAAGKKRCIRIEARPKPPAKPAPRNPKK